MRSSRASTWLQTTLETDINKKTMKGIDENGNEVDVICTVGEAFMTTNPDTGEDEYWEVTEVGEDGYLTACVPLTKEEWDNHA